MTTHSQDRGSSIWRAWASVPADLLGAALDVHRVKDDRNVMRETQASALYEELRLLTHDQLIERAGFKAPRQQLIASIICDTIEA